MWKLALSLILLCPFSSASKINTNRKDKLHNLLQQSSSSTSSSLSSSTTPRNLEEYNINTHISQYSIQFQGCHHIQQWNNNADDDAVRVQTKRLVRFRLVAYDQCEVTPRWATSSYFENVQSVITGYGDYGEYIVDMSTFVENYLAAQVEDCEIYYEMCQDQCQSQSDDPYYDSSNCVTNCYSKYNCNAAGGEYYAYGGDDDFDVFQYTQCTQINLQTDDGYQYYVGPSCTNQGGEIRLDLFTDDTCTTRAKCGSSSGAKCYQQLTGSKLPFSDVSLIEDFCFPCTENYLTAEALGDDADLSSFDFGYPRDVCDALYTLAGKCEKHMSASNSNSACSYIQGIRIGVSDDGLPTAIKRSFAADVVMGALVISISFVGMYIIYLHHLLSIPGPEDEEYYK